MKKLAILLVLALFACQSPQKASPVPTPHALVAPGQVGPFVIPQSWKQPAFYIDYQNTLGCASDNNRTCGVSNCSTSGDGPCLTYGSLATRWGTYGPWFQQVTTIGVLSSDTNGYSDPIVFNPNCTYTGSVYPVVVWVGTPTVVASGTLASGTNLVHGSAGSGTLTTASYAGVTGGSLAVGQFVTDTTLSPNAGWWLYLNTSGSTWTSTTPLRLGSTFPSVGQYGPISTPSIIGATDSVTVKTFPTIALAEVRPVGWPSSNVACVTFRGIQTNYYSETVVGTGVQFQDSRIFNSASFVSDGRAVVTAGNGDESYSSVLYNSDLVGANTTYVSSEQYQGGTGAGSRVTGTVLIAGGEACADAAPSGTSSYFCNLGSVSVWFDAIVGGHAPGGNAFGGYTVLGRSQIGGMYNDMTTATDFLIFANDVYIGADSFEFENGILWGGGASELEDAHRLTYQATATNTFLGSTLPTIGGGTTACSLSGASTITCGITVTNTHLDTSASATSFGGNAFLLGYGSFTQSSEP